MAWMTVDLPAPDGLEQRGDAWRVEPERDVEREGPQPMTKRNLCAHGLLLMRLASAR